MLSELNHLWFRNLYYRYVKCNRYPLGEGKRFDNKIKSLKNKHEGHICFIIGNGPSLSPEDLSKIYELGVVSFAANSIYKLYDKTVWRPTYHCLQDWEVIEGLTVHFSDLLETIDGLFIRRDAYRLVSSSVAKHSKTYMPKLIMHIREDNMFDFSEDISRFISDGTTITYFMMQLAYYMGFKKIYLIGIDHNFPIIFDENNEIVQTKNVKQHAFEDDKAIKLNPARVHESTCAYKSARAFFEAHGVECYNTTRGGKLEVFIRANLDDIFDDLNE